MLLLALQNVTDAQAPMRRRHVRSTLDDDSLTFLVLGRWDTSLVLFDFGRHAFEVTVVNSKTLHCFPTAIITTDD